MNTPTGFIIKNGQVTGINPLQAMFNPSTPYETVHMMLACYVATGFGVAAVYAFGLLRGKRDEYHRKGLMLAMAMGLIAIPLQIVSGDLNARFLYDAQPTKFAAMEAVFKTQQGAPISVGGLADPKTGQIYYALEIPKGLSLLATYNPNSTVRGLEQLATPADWPNVELVHFSFDAMVGTGFFTLFIAFLFWFLYWRKKRNVPENRLMLLGILLAGPLSFLAIEFGWMVTELGRQPWVIYGYLRTKDAVTTAPWLDYSFLVFSLIYVLLAVTLVWLLLHIARSPLPEVNTPGEVEQKPETVGV
jgi:cytochrome bd ubiquinol oxidase subunit I